MCASQLGASRESVSTTLLRWRSRRRAPQGIDEAMEPSARESTKRGARERSSCRRTSSDSWGSSRRAGRIDDALGTLDRAIELAAASDERFCEAELYRLRGELALRPRRRAKTKQMRTPRARELSPAGRSRPYCSFARPSVPALSSGRAVATRRPPLPCSTSTTVRGRVRDARPARRARVPRQSPAPPRR